MRTRSRIASLTVVACAVLTSAGVGGAYAAPAHSAWWQLTSGSRPSLLTPGSARSEVQEISVEPAPGETAAAFELRFNNQSLGTFATEPLAAEAGVPEATPANVQAALEGAYGSGNVTVTGGPIGTTSLIVNNVSGTADQIVRPIEVASVGVGTPHTKVLTEGHPAGEVVVTAENLGFGVVDGLGTPVKVSDVLPAGVTAVGISAWRPGEHGIANRLTQVPCNLETLTCTAAASILPYEQIEVRIAVRVEPSTSSGALNKVTVTGGGVNPRKLERPLDVGGGSTPFGVQEYALTAEGEDGSPETQAGSHPFQVSTTLDFNQEADHALMDEKLEVQPVGAPKDADLHWPAGLIGNINAVPQCTLAQFFTVSEKAEENECPAQTAIGVVVATVDVPASSGPNIGSAIFTLPVFNLEPKPGEPARVGFYPTISHSPVVIDTSVRTGSDYGIDIDSRNLTQTAGLLSAHVTIWGVPGDARHDSERGYGCIAVAQEAEYGHRPCNPLEESEPAPFLAMPTACVGPLSTTGGLDSWTAQGVFAPFSADQPMAGLNGCGQLPFQPSISVAPEKTSASEATGLAADAHIGQESSKNARGLISSALRDMTVRLPVGVTVNPSAANGLQACSEAEIGYLPSEGGPGDLRFTPGIPSPTCPDAAKIGTVAITTPVLSHALEGSVYLAAQGANPFGSLVAMYLIAEDPVTGTLVKLAGNVSLDEHTGQITTSFEGTPDVPLEDARFNFFGGPRSALVTPSHCGSYKTEAVATPWSGTEPVQLTSTFNITSGPNGGLCPATLPFSPSTAIGTTNAQAGALTPLVTTISRSDGDQALQGVNVQLPPGFSALLTKVALCGEQQANAGTCGPDSLLGSASVAGGVGSEPVAVTGGRVYLTGPYRGAPFGLSIVTRAKAGPFDLGNVIVRAKIEVDPHTAQVRVITDPSGPFAIPTILDGIPLHLKQLSVQLTRPEFGFNPTNCKPLSLATTLTGEEGAVAGQSIPFHAVNCAKLRFTPSFSVSTSGKTSKAKGASLSTTLSYPAGSLGAQSNIAKVRVTLPRQLPSRLTTLQKACLAATFEANPANCPAASLVGHATVTTPVLPVPLNGPAYLVSHGGEAFPSLTIVLQGYGVTVDLVGTTAIRKGITTTTFNSVPDVPFNRFSLTLPQGKYSVLAAIGNLCKSKLSMPTIFVGQNGAEIHRTTKIGVTGCPKHKAKPAKHTKKRRKKRA